MRFIHFGGQARLLSLSGLCRARACHGIPGMARFKGAFCVSVAVATGGERCEKHRRATKKLMDQVDAIIQTCFDESSGFFDTTSPALAALWMPPAGAPDPCY